MEETVSHFLQWKWTSINAWFCAVLPMKDNNNEVEVVIIGSKHKKGVKVFSPTEMTNLGLQRIRYVTEVLREVFRRAFKLERSQTPIHLEVFSSKGNRNCAGLRILALIWAHFYDVDMVEVSQLGNNALRALLFFSKPAEDALRSALLKRESEKLGITANT